MRPRAPPPHTAAMCTAKCGTGTLCTSKKVGGSEYCYVHLRIKNPEKAKEYSEVKLAEEAREVVAKEERARARAAAKADKAQRLQACVEKLRQDRSAMQ